MPFEDGGAKPFQSTGEGTSSISSTSSIKDTSNEYDISGNNNDDDNHTNDGNDNNDNSDSNCTKKTKTKLTMWQLSFSDLTEEEGCRLRSAAPDDLLAEALKRCEGWFEPVCGMIKGTPKGKCFSVRILTVIIIIFNIIMVIIIIIVITIIIVIITIIITIIIIIYIKRHCYHFTGEVWGTALYDRNPMPLRGKDQGSRVTVIGDACHPMVRYSKLETRLFTIS
jgi:hypothetical protein